MTHMLIEDGLQAEIEAARMDMARDLEANPQVARTVMAIARERVLEAFPNPAGIDERRLLVHVIAALTLSLEAEATS